MAEINPTSSVPTWPSNRVVNSSQGGKHSPKHQQKHKNDNEQNDEPVDTELNSKKKSPGNQMNSHIDEYA